MIENEDYELIPADDEQWNVRVLSGIYNETVIEFGALKIKDDPANDCGILKFDFNIIESPDQSLTTDDKNFEKFCGDMLVSILESAIENKEVIKREVE